ncbi:hypothetical protein M8C21_006476 [Ambrosia artemisiifolia]|uniref:Uncharacterized protein n=1 Tax=Ambrosia artemisiifolia TaxID=4212 RepID=A0AAD5CGI5_AMBAR|nr:hypothetical protein M8C21_006476 [Ambrosia artemisiifolia]
MVEEEQVKREDSMKEMSYSELEKLKAERKKQKEKTVNFILAWMYHENNQLIRLVQKRKIQQAYGTSEVQGDHQQAAKVIRRFPQTKPVRDGGEKQKPGLSKDLLAGVFGGWS